MAQKKFQDLNLKDAFLFAAALSDAETCKLVLEIILGEKIDRVTVHAEHTLLFSSDFRNIRMDIYALDEGKTCYNVEMQGENKGNLPWRSRYHQATMDLDFLKPGNNFQDLIPCYVIFICTFDPFGLGLYRYTFENRCLEHDLSLGDGTQKIFLNTKGKNADQIPAELLHLLQYVETSTDICAKGTNDIAVKMLHQKVASLKESRKWEKNYMTFGELLDDAKAETFTAAQNRFCLLIEKMTAAGESDKLPLLSDAAFLQEMYQKYDLSDCI